MAAKRHAYTHECDVDQRCGPYNGKTTKEATAEIVKRNCDEGQESKEVKVKQERG